MKDYVQNINQEFIVSGFNLSGISSIDAGYNVPSMEPLALGNVYEPRPIQNSPGQGRFSFERTMISVDESITSLIGETGGFDGGLTYNSKNLNFTTGYVSSYSCSFNIDQLPTSNVEITSFGDFGPSVKIKKNSESKQDIFIPMSSGISLECDGRETNRVLNFSMNISCQLTPLYKIGSIYPCEIISERPIKQTISIELEVDDYETKDLYDYITKGFHKKDIKISLKNKCGQENKVEYIFNNCFLMNENLNTNAEDTTRVSLQYSSSTMAKPNFKYL